MHLTRSVVLEILPAKEKIVIADDTLQGLYLVIMPGGKRSWALRYTVGRTRKLFIFGDATIILPGEARTRAARLLAQVKLGKDPAKMRKQAVTPVRHARLGEDPTDETKEHKLDTFEQDRPVADLAKILFALIESPNTKEQARGILGQIINLGYSCETLWPFLPEFRKKYIAYKRKIAQN